MLTYQMIAKIVLEHFVTEVNFCYLFSAVEASICYALGQRWTNYSPGAACGSHA